jgi:uncharacterized protein
MTTRQTTHPRQISFILYLIIFHAAWVAWVLIGYPHLRNVGEKTLLYALINLTVRGLIWLLPVFVYLRYVEGVGPWNYLKLGKRWMLGVIVGLGLTALNFLLQLAVHGPPQFGDRGLTWNSILSTSLLIGFVEEVPYRGLIFQKLNEWTSFPVAALISSLLFLAIHLPGWLSLHMYRTQSAVFVFVFGLVMTTLLRFTNSLWAPIVSHSTNDFLSAVLFHN